MSGDLTGRRPGIPISRLPAARFDRQKHWPAFSLVRSLCLSVWHVRGSAYIPPRLTAACTRTPSMPACGSRLIVQRGTKRSKDYLLNSLLFLPSEILFWQLAGGGTTDSILLRTEQGKKRKKPRLRRREASSLATIRLGWQT